MHDEFLKGNLEDAPVPALADRRALAVGRRHFYVKRPAMSVRFYGLNTRTKPLSDRRVRQAIVHAIDREAIVPDVYARQYTFARGVRPPGALGITPRLGGDACDPSRARGVSAGGGY